MAIASLEEAPAHVAPVRLAPPEPPHPAAPAPEMNLVMIALLVAFLAATGLYWWLG